MTIQLQGVSVHTNHGVGEAEREVGQRMVFDVDLSLLECRAAETDDLDGTVDYSVVTEMLVEIATERSYLTLERLTAVIAERLLDQFGATMVRVRATKPEPPIAVVMEGASVELILRRQPDSAPE
ncbi:MAG TPA: dihydroneopterin aldolase [Solirubrobacterales bacterium]|nr:dihydroneopterin aldolase [Solirubrobacterales bacterium]